MPKGTPRYGNSHNPDQSPDNFPAGPCMVSSRARVVVLLNVPGGPCPGDATAQYVQRTHSAVGTRAACCTPNASHVHTTVMVPAFEVCAARITRPSTCVQAPIQTTTEWVGHHQPGWTNCRSMILCMAAERCVVYKHRQACSHPCAAPRSTSRQAPAVCLLCLFSQVI